MRIRLARRPVLVAARISIALAAFGFLGLLAARPAGATRFRMTVTGQGTLTGSSTVNLGPTSATLEYEDSQFTLIGTPVFATGTGVVFSTPPIPVRVVAGGTTYVVDPILQFSAFDQPGDSDQLNLTPFLQWNDATGTAFTAPLPQTFSAIHALAVEQIATNPHLLLANTGPTFIPVDGDSSSQLRIQNSVVRIERVSVTAIPTLGEWGLGGLALLLAGAGSMSLRRRSFAAPPDVSR